ncbi:hypothetical protein V2A60_009578 [Cordyceps javanica]
MRLPFRSNLAQRNEPKEQKYDRIAKMFVKEYKEKLVARVFLEIGRGAQDFFRELLKENGMDGQVIWAWKSLEDLEKRIMGVHEREKFIKFLDLGRRSAESEQALMRKLYQHADLDNLISVSVQLRPPRDILESTRTLFAALSKRPNFRVADNYTQSIDAQRDENIKIYGYQPSIQNVRDPFEYESYRLVIHGNQAPGGHADVSASDIFSSYRIEVRVETLQPKAWAEVHLEVFDLMSGRSGERVLKPNLERLRRGAKAGSITADISLAEQEIMLTLTEYAKFRKDLLELAGRGWRYAGDDVMAGDPYEDDVTEGYHSGDRTAVLHFACMAGGQSTVAKLLPGLPRTRDYARKVLGGTALRFACVSRCPGVAKLLLASVDEIDPRLANACAKEVIRYALRHGNDDTVKTLLARLDDAAVRAQDKFGDTLLHFACRLDQNIMVRMLIPRFDKDSLQLKGRAGLTAFREARALGNDRAAEEFEGQVDCADLAAP